MTFSERINFLWFDVKDCLSSIKARIWNKGLLLWWYRLWIREDEFHQSLSMDVKAIFEMNKEEEKEYREDLMRRRRIAHQRSLKEL